MVLINLRRCSVAAAFFRYSSEVLQGSAEPQTSELLTFSVQIFEFLSASSLVVAIFNQLLRQKLL